MDIEKVRQELGDRYGLGRPLFKSELARLIGLKPGMGNMVTKIEAGRANMSGPVEVVIRMLLEGHLSPWHGQALRLRRNGGVPTTQRPRKAA